MMTKKVILISSIYIFSTFLSFGKEFSSSLKVYESVISPVLEAKCVSCHGAEKDKGKLRMHTSEALIKGGRGAGEDIIVKGEVDDSELIYRITLPKEDEEAMPPMEDEAHYNPVTEQELSVLKSWIKMGASFDMLIKDLDEAGKQAADYVLKNLPEKKLSATALLIPKLPEVPQADAQIVQKLRDSGILIMPIAQNTNALYVNASYKGKSFDDENAKLLQSIAPQLLWLNIARTAVTDEVAETLSKFTLLERLHAENTSLTDGATPNLSRLSNLKYLNLYGTDISDASIENFRKLKKLEKIFLWQTKVTSEGAESLRKNFVDQSVYANLLKEKETLSAKVEEISSSFETQLSKLADKQSSLSQKTMDTSPINGKCPIANKSVDAAKSVIFEGRMVGLCCDKCKSKFIKDPSSYRSKIANFEASKEFKEIQTIIKNKEENKDQELEKIGVELRDISAKLNSMGPEINLGWTVAKSK